MRKHLLFLTTILIYSNLYINAREVITSGSAKVAKQYTTSETGNLRLSYVGELQFGDKSQTGEAETSIFVNQNKKFQTVLGIGGALTDASAETFAKMPVEKQKAFLKSYYNPIDGIGYTLGRTSIHSCDFSSGSYTYVEDKDAGKKHLV